jgi:hypothetical protein
MVIPAKSAQLRNRRFLLSLVTVSAAMLGKIIMNDEKVMALEVALKYVLIEVQSKGINIQELAEAVSESLIRTRIPRKLATQAAIAIEIVSDRLHYPV